MVRVAQLWVLASDRSVYTVSEHKMGCAYSAPEGSVVSHLRSVKDGTAVLFCVSRGWRWTCTRLDVRLMTPEEVYSIGRSRSEGAHISARSIVYLSEDPGRTVLAVDRPFGSDSGVLGVGLSIKTGTPLTVLRPSDLGLSERSYEWYPAADGKGLLLRSPVGTGQERYWFLGLRGDLEPMPVTEQEWTSMIRRSADEAPLPAEILARIKSSLKAKYLTGEPGRRNYYMPIRGPGR